MVWFAEDGRAFGAPRSLASDEARDAERAADAVDTSHAPDAAVEESSPATLAAKAQRLAELQEELHQLERLPSLPCGAMDGGSELMAGVMPPSWYERMVEIECEIEQLREEMAGEDASPSAPHPRAAEEIGDRILQQLGTGAGVSGDRELTPAREAEDDAVEEDEVVALS